MQLLIRLFLFAVAGLVFIPLIQSGSYLALLIIIVIFVVILYFSKGRPFF